LWSSAGDVPSLDASIVFISIIVCQWVACVLNLGALLMRRRLSEWSLGLQRFSSFCSYSFSVVRWICLAKLSWLCNMLALFTGLCSDVEFVSSIVCLLMVVVFT
jgi:hypothetical protein